MSSSYKVLNLPAMHGFILRGPSELDTATLNKVTALGKRRASLATEFCRAYDIERGSDVAEQGPLEYLVACGERLSALNNAEVALEDHPIAGTLDWEDDTLRDATYRLHRDYVASGDYGTEKLAEHVRCFFEAWGLEGWCSDTHALTYSRPSHPGQQLMFVGALYDAPATKLFDAVTVMVALNLLAVAGIEH